MYADFQAIFSSESFKKTANIQIFNAFFERIRAGKWTKRCVQEFSSKLLEQRSAAQRVQDHLSVNAHGEIVWMVDVVA